MMHEQAAEHLIADYISRAYLRGKADCATLCADYIRHRTGTVPDFADEGKPPTLGKVRGVLGDPTDDVGAGCVVLCADGVLAVHLGYCLLTMIEGMGLARKETNDIKAGWVI